MILVSLGKYLEAYEIFPSWANLFFLGCILRQLHHMKCINAWKTINIAKTDVIIYSSWLLWALPMSCILLKWIYLL